MHVIRGGFQVGSTCSACGGEGVKTPRGSACKTCHGNGVVREKKAVNVNIPGGIEDGQRVRINSEGDAPVSGTSQSPDARKTPGHLYVHISVATDPKFSRSGSDILHTASIPLTTAILGGEVVVPTLDGEVKIKIATGTATGDKVTLSGMGMNKLEQRRGKGDLKVEFKIQMPKYLSASQRTIAEFLADELKDKTAKRIMNVNRER